MSDATEPCQWLWAPERGLRRDRSGTGHPSRRMQSRKRGTGCLASARRHKPLGERIFAILAAFAQFDAQAYPPGSDVRDLQMADRVGSESRGAGRHQHGEVLDVPGDREQADQTVSRRISLSWLRASGRTDGVLAPGT